MLADLLTDTRALALVHAKAHVEQPWHKAALVVCGCKAETLAEHGAAGCPLSLIGHDRPSRLGCKYC